MENGGQALLDELNIEKASFRKKIVRLVNARMLGFGSKPNEPSGIQIHLEGCSTAILKWRKPKADGFPVHKFRVQRRRLSSNNDLPQIILKEEESPQSICSITQNQRKDDGNISANFDKSLVHHLYNNFDRRTCPSDSSDSKDHEIPIANNQDQPNPLEWRDVYDKGMPEFHDFGLERGHKGYQYRIQAWNAVGKSDWVQVETRQWGRNKCHRQMEKTVPRENNSFSSKFKWLNIIWTAFNSVHTVIMGLFGVFVTIFKLKRAMLPSSATRMNPTFPWLFKGINGLTKAVIGIDIVPQHFSSTNTETPADIHYDVTVKSVGLFGYEKSNLSNRPGMTSAPSSRKVGLSTQTNSGSRLLSPVVQSSRKVTQPSEAKREEQESSVMPTVRNEKNSNPFSRKKTMIQFSGNGKKSSLRDVRDSIQKEQSGKTEMSSVMESDLAQNSWASLNNCLSASYESLKSLDDIATGKTGPTESLHSNLANDDEESEFCDNNCIVCKKKYKFLKRKKHHCSVCFSTFCHKHGKTTHSNLVACKVPGDCVCNVCLGVS